METTKLLEIYAKNVVHANQNLFNVAMEEMTSSQYEEAAIHFDQLYVNDSTDFMSYYFRAYCKAHYGKRGEVHASAQKLTSACKKSYQKAIEANVDIDTRVSLILQMYAEGMKHLAYNAIDDSFSIEQGYRDTLVEFINCYMELINQCDTLKTYILSELQELLSENLDKYGALIVALVPEYAPTLENKKQQERQRLQQEQERQRLQQEQERQRLQKLAEERKNAEDNEARKKAIAFFLFAVGIAVAVMYYCFVYLA